MLQIFVLNMFLLMEKLNAMEVEKVAYEKATNVVKEKVT